MERFPELLAFSAGFLVCFLCVAVVALLAVLVWLVRRLYRYLVARFAHLSEDDIRRLLSPGEGR